MFLDELTARAYFEGRLWPNGVICPICSGQDRITTRKRAGFFRCNRCLLDFTVRTGTVFERSHISLGNWLAAMNLLAESNNTIASARIADVIGSTQPTAWFVRSRLREACGGEMEQVLTLDAMVDIVLSYRPEGKSKEPRHRKKKA